MIVNFKKKDDRTILPQKMSDGAACYDVYAHSFNMIKPHKIEVGLGFMTEIPKGWKGIIAARSSLSKTNWIIGNSFGIIDSDYRGEWKVIFSYVGTEKDGKLVVFPYKIGDRVGQIYFEPVWNFEMKEVEELSETARGEGGFGSTDKK